jgi:hypothetical protein
MRTDPITGLAAGTYTITATLSQSPDCAANFTITGQGVLDITETHTESLASQVIMMDQFQ